MNIRNSFRTINRFTVVASTLLALGQGLAHADAMAGADIKVQYSSLAAVTR